VRPLPLPPSGMGAMPLRETKATEKLEGQDNVHRAVVVVRAPGRGNVELEDAAARTPCNVKVPGRTAPLLHVAPPRTASRCEGGAAKLQRDNEELHTLAPFFPSEQRPCLSDRCTSLLF
jgi:hypothetical protein